MLKSVIDKAIECLSCPKENEEDALATAAFILILLLQQESAYVKSKARPVSEMQSLIYWATLAVKPMANRLSTSDGFPLKKGVNVKRELDNTAKFRIACSELDSPKNSPEYHSYEYSICISFAGEQRELAEKIAKELRDKYHLSVFYDDFEKTKLWGEDLFNFLHETYSIKSEYCLILFSKAYLEKNWTVHELRAAQSRAVKEKRAYILPLLCETGVKPPVVFETTAYLSILTTSIDDICSQLNERAWKQKGQHWLMEDEILELFNEGSQVQFFFEPFKNQIEKSSNSREKLLTLVFGLMWVTSNANVVSTLKSIVDYMLYAYPPISELFNDQDEFTLIPPKGRIRRFLQENESSMLMRDEFWSPLAQEWQKKNGMNENAAGKTVLKARSRKVIKQGHIPSPAKAKGKSKKKTK